MLAHHRVEGMNFIPGGYSFSDWIEGSRGDEIEMSGGANEIAISSILYVTRSTAGREGASPPLMSVNLRRAP